MTTIAPATITPSRTSTPAARECADEPPIPPDPSPPHSKPQRSRGWETVDNVGRAGGAAAGEVGFLTGLLTRDDDGGIRGLSTAGQLATGGMLTSGAGLYLLSRLGKLGSGTAAGTMGKVGLTLAALAPTTAAIIASPVAGELAQGLGVVPKMQDPATATDRENKNYIEDKNGQAKLVRLLVGAGAGVAASVGVALLRKRAPSAEEAKLGADGLLKLVRTARGGDKVPLQQFLRNRVMSHLVVPGTLGGVSGYSIYNLHDQKGDFSRTKTISRGW